MVYGCLVSTLKTLIGKKNNANLRHSDLFLYAFHKTRFI